MMWMQQQQQQQQQQNVTSEWLHAKHTFLVHAKNLTTFNKIMGDVIELGTMLIGFMGT
jgi:hypothetical protein